MGTVGKGRAPQEVSQLVPSNSLEEAMLEEARAEIGVADQKASLLLASLGIGFGVVLGGLLAGDWEPSDLEGAAEPVWWVAAALALLSVGFAAAAVWPRFSQRPAGQAIYYWGDVAAQRTFDELEERLKESPPTSTERLRHQLWDLSRIVTRKYRFVRAAFASAAIAMLAFGISALLS